jgi:hypothetical protein
MTTRRKALLIGLGSGYIVLGFSPGDFWNDKPPSEWSEKEIERLLTKSPWAKEASPHMNLPGMSGPDGGGGMPGGRGGGPGLIPRF